ncbi:MAG: membrane protein insertase YidC [Acinetobacter sp.]|jgi:YidC/Oxa1 family membrane protein insertase|nr:MAG: membrane protein insertase YidC [Acinetobacter sp.]
MQQWTRFAILGAMFVTAYLLILAWQKDYGHVKDTTPQPVVATQTRDSTADLPTHQPTTAITDLPQVVEPVQHLAATAPTATQSLIAVQTDMYNVWIDPKGGDVVRLELLSHDKSKDSNQPFVMLQNDQHVYIARSGLIGTNGIDTAAGRPLYQVSKKTYSLADAKVVAEGDKQIQVIDVPMVFKTPEGVEVFKTFSFKSGEYPIAVKYRIVNRSANNWQGQMFGELKRDNADDPGKSSQGIFTLGTYLGGAWGTPEAHYNKLKFANFSDEKLNTQAQAGWVAIVQHYFVSAWIPDASYTAQLESRNVGNDHIIGFRSPVLNVAAGKQYEIGATLYSGPKIQSELKGLATGLNQTVDYGWLWIIAQPLFWGLKFFHQLVGNWGWSIVLLTVLVKLILWPLSAKSYRSMAKMRVIAPEMQRMKEEFGDDRMRFSQEMMALYKREQVNPLSGCLPLLLQMPIFLALYWVLMESVELRHAPWMLWIQDLSAMDPWFILPLIMGVTMFVQQMLNPQPTDPMQAKVFRLMPIAFTVFLLFFPAGLVLYWIVNNLITIAQQWFINKTTEKSRVVVSSK